MSKEGSAIGFRPTIPEYAAVANIVYRAGILHLKASRTLAKEGIEWYPNGSILLSIMSGLTGRTIPDTMLPLTTYSNHYMRQTDDLFDASEEFPSWVELKNGVQQTQSVLLNAIAETDLDPDKKLVIFRRIASLRREAYSALQQKNNWTDDPTFDEAYGHRINTTGLLSRAFGVIWCIVTDTPGEEWEKTQEASQRIGMTFQYVDDLMDIRDDAPIDGNLVLAAFNGNKEEKQEITQALDRVTGKPRVMDLLRRYAPQSTSYLLDRINDEIVPIKDISASTEQTMRGIVKFVLPRIVISNDSFFRKIQIW